MSSTIPAACVASLVAQSAHAGYGHHIFGVEDPQIHCHGGGGEFEGRAGWLRGAGGPVEEGVGLIFHEA